MHLAIWDGDERGFSREVGGRLGIDHWDSPVGPHFRKDLTIVMPIQRVVKLIPKDSILHQLQGRRRLQGEDG